MVFKPEDKPTLELGCLAWFSLEMLRWSLNSDLTGRRYLELFYQNRRSFEEILSPYQASCEVIGGTLNYIHASLIDLSKVACNERHTSTEAYEADRRRINDIIDEAERYMFKPR